MLRKAEIVLYTLFILLFLGSCKKNDPAEEFTAYNNVKLFDDPQASPQTTYERIVAGNNRLCMTYGSGALGNSVVPTIQVLVTDNDGKLIRHDSISSSFTLYGLISLNDGTFAVVAASSFSGACFFFHYNQNGEKISVDSIQLPGGSSLGTVSRSRQGNILICAWGINNGYILESDINGQILWSKPSSAALSGGCPTDDGGYLFTYDSVVKFCLLKTNDIGDSLWQKTFYTPYTPFSSSSICYRIASAGNGRYRICVNNLDAWNNNPNAPAPLYIYEVNEAGDSVNSATISEKVINYEGAMLDKGDGNTFILLTAYFNELGFGRPTISFQDNTHYVTLDAGMNIKEHGALQNQSTDLFDAVCKTSDGRIACFGIIQSYHKQYFKPGLTILN